MRKNIYKKIFFPHFILFILLALYIFVYNYQQIYKQNKDLMIHELKEKIWLIEPVAVPYMVDSTYRELDLFIKKIGDRLDSRITIVRADGIVLGESDNKPEEMVNHIHRPEIQQALHDGWGTATRYSNTVKADMIYVAHVIRHEGQVIGFIRMASYLNWIKEFVSSSLLGFVMVLLVGVVLASFVGFILTRWIIDPVSRLTKFAAGLFENDFRDRIDINTGDEIEKLARTMNNMADEIQHLLQTIRNENEELSVIINNLHEGLVVIDVDGKILQSNITFRTLIGNEQLKNRYYWEIIRKEEFRVFIENFNLKQSQDRLKMELNGRYLEINVSSLQNTGELIIVFHDRTESHNLEVTKRDFVANVSHELRTPLTAMMGFIETIEEDPSTQERFLKIIKRNTQRLINLTEDLQVLSKLENQDVKNEMAVIDLRTVIEHTARIFQKKMAEKKLKFEIKLPDEALTIKGDTMKIEQMLINLLENALRYTDNGSVTVIGEKLGELVQLVVEDSGLGIPDRLKERIFERFFTINGARSRQNGGTGLGLSIVKHIVKMHDATIDVQSELGVGSKFIIRFKRA